DAGHRPFEGHVEQVPVEHSKPVRGLQQPRLDRLKNVLSKSRVADVQVLQRDDVQLMPCLGLGRQLSFVKQHYRPTSPSCLSLNTASAWRNRPGMGTPISPRFSTMDRASLARYHQMATVRRMGSPRPPSWSRMFPTATTTNMPMFLAMPRRPASDDSRPCTHAAAQPVT